MTDLAMKQRVPPGDWPDGGLERLGACPVCGSARRSVADTELKDQIYFCAPGLWTAYVCGDCGSVYLDPRPSAATIELAYSRYYTHRATAPELYAEDASWGWRGRFQRNATNGYLNAAYGFHRLPANVLGPALMLLAPRRKALRDREFRHLRLPHPSARLLDVGCGNGAFVQRAQANGWCAYGLEPDPRAAEAARAAGLSVSEGTLDTVTFEAATFDAITMDHVIEHLHDPVKALATCFRLLRPGGALWIATPNLEAEGRRTFGRYWLGLDPPRHLVLFTAGSLERALRRSGFGSCRLCRSDFCADHWFKTSAMIRLGEDVLKLPYTPLSPEMQRLARRVDLRALLNPRRGEELIMLARKDGS